MSGLAVLRTKPRNDHTGLIAGGQTRQTLTSVARRCAVQIDETSPAA